MIIVSQNKKVMINFDKVVGVQVEGKRISLQFINERILCLGDYKTEERAKEVLEELTRRFSFKEISGGSYQQLDVQIKLTHLARYEMPLE